MTPIRTFRSGMLVQNYSASRMSGYVTAGSADTLKSRDLHRLAVVEWNRVIAHTIERIGSRPDAK
jgi:hypothetical protein